jgi:hypothetical protein
MAVPPPVPAHDAVLLPPADIPSKGNETRNETINGHRIEHSEAFTSHAFISIVPESAYNVLVLREMAADVSRL